MHSDEGVTAFKMQNWKNWETQTYPMHIYEKQH